MANICNFYGAYHERAQMSNLNIAIPQKAKYIIHMAPTPKGLNFAIYIISIPKGNKYII